MVEIGKWCINQTIKQFLKHQREAKVFHHFLHKQIIKQTSKQSKNETSANGQGCVINVCINKQSNKPTTKQENKQTNTFWSNSERQVCVTNVCANKHTIKQAKKQTNSQSNKQKQLPLEATARGKVVSQMFAQTNIQSSKQRNKQTANQTNKNNYLLKQQREARLCHQHLHQCQQYCSQAAVTGESFEVGTYI